MIERLDDQQRADKVEIPGALDDWPSRRQATPARLAWHRRLGADGVSPCPTARECEAFNAGYAAALSARSAAVPSVPLDGAPRELWLAKGRLSGQWEHHAFREPTVAGWQRYVREDLTLQSASGRSEIEVEESTDSIGDWQCKGYADDWITFPTRKAAERYQESTGALMRYVRFYHHTTTRRAKDV